MSHYDVAVIGLGIVGANAVYATARAGARVLAIDAGLPGAGTSGTSFAWLNSVRKEPEAYHRLNVAGMSAHRDLARDLGDDGAHHFGGSLEWADAGDGERELRARVERLAGWGYAAEFISRERAAAMEPGLEFPGHVREVAFFGADGWLDAPGLIRRLLSAAASKHGAEVRERAPVRSFRARGDRIEGLVTDGGETVAESVLVCVGPATQAFLELLRAMVPVGRAPGLLAVTSPPGAKLDRVVHAPGIHLRPDAGGGLLLGTEDVDKLAVSAGASANLPELAAILLERAGRVFSGARGVKVVDSRIGVRPMPADGHTIAGRIPGYANAWVLATHSGVTLGALLGRLIADEIVRGASSPMLAPFRPDRFVA
ncbi:MAG: FAD-dependent oxidoreductase [Candidatus Rokuibacteriota bacterium]|nr:MAG: FAD-dependent oxidoreductase [Candidatus Rokubacteria bacterium]